MTTFIVNDISKFFLTNLPEPRVCQCSRFMLRQPKSWIYVGGEYLSALAQGFEAKPVDSGENVVVLIPDDDGVFYMANAGYVGEHRMPCTQPVQTYVDVFHCGGRGQEAAEAALEQRRKPERKQRGLL